ncbi:MAG: glycosyltransferase [Bacteroidetes bacterium]|nr:glycosyltransferase [Bacteroidota bacterium]
MENNRAEKRVCHLSTVHSVSDDRIFYKECVSLARHGFSVSFLVPHSRDEVRNGVQIIALKEYRNRFVRVIIGGWCGFRKAMKTKAQLIHFHDPELIPVGFILKLFGRKVIYDVHELVFHHMDQKEWGNAIGRSFLKFLYRFLEGLAIRFFDRIILVVDDDQFRDYFFTTYKKRIPKFVFIRNFSMIGFTDDLPAAALEKKQDIIIYAGGLDRNRGIREVIAATALMSPSPLFIIFGKWSDEKYEAECRREEGWKNVQYMGYRKLEELYPFIKVADLGIALLYPLKNYLTSLPVKAFEYMACSVPILMSDFPFWMKKFESCAFFTDPSDPEIIAKMLQEILKDKAILQEKGRAGRLLVEQQYSWEAEEKTLISCYEELFSSPNKQ